MFDTELFIALLIGVLSGIFAKSLLIGLSTTILFLTNPYSLNSIPPYSGYVIILVLILLIVLSYKRGLWDSAAEVILWPGKYYLTPILSVVTLATILFSFNFKIVYNPFYPVGVAINTVLSSKQANSLPKAIIFSAISSLGQIGSITLLFYTSYAPLPPLSCNGIHIGELVGFEAETSTTRSIIKNRNWKDRILACTIKSRAVLSTGKRSVIWLYSSDPRRQILGIVKRIPEKNRVLVVDLDSITPCKELGGVTTRCLGDLMEPELTAKLYALYDDIEQYTRVIIMSCRFKPRSLARAASLLATRTTVLVSLCIPEEDTLIPSAGPEGGGTILSSLGDPLLERSILGKILEYDTFRMSQLLHRENLALAYPYCGNRWALIRLLRILSS